MLYRGTEILLGRRKGSHGAGEWAFPGGKLEYMETFGQCAVRELVEEIGPQVRFKKLFPFSVINLTEYAPKHYIDVCMAAEWVSGEPIVMEPDKCEEWRWFKMYNLPTPRFATIDRVLDAYIGDSPYIMDAEDGC